MSETPTPKLLYITTPTPDTPTLNIQLGEHFVRFRLTREQLLNLNAESADALRQGHYHHVRQYTLPLDDAG
jgi:hypothetical protein